MGSKWTPWRPIENLPGDLISRYIDGVVFDVEMNNFWSDSFGDRGESNTGDVAKARQWLESNAPKLVPIFAHRVMSSEPCVAGQPVLSVMQTDIIIYGLDLPHYLSQEFDFEPVAPVPEKVKVTIPFWMQLVG